MNTNRVALNTIRPGNYFRLDGLSTIYRALCVKVGEPGTGTLVTYTIDGTQCYMEFRKPSFTYVELIRNV